MSSPPLVLSVVVGETGKRKFHLWFPVFLLVPFAYIAIACFDLIFIPFIIVFAPKSRRLSHGRVALVEPFRILNATKGITIDIENPYHRVLIQVS